MLHEVQARFRRAVTQGDDGALLAVLAATMPGHIPPARRIAVHRNTFFGTLIEGLQAAYPVVTALVGERFFHSAARLFIEAGPPPRPDLAAYGGGLAAFLDSFPPAASVAYLGDVARLEWARVEATFAAEAVPLTAADLAMVPPEAVAGLRLILHPSARLVTSRWAIQSIWDAHQFDPVTPVDPAVSPERVLIIRPRDTMVARRLSVGEASLLAALLAGEALGEAAATALQEQGDLDLPAALAALFQGGAVVGCDASGGQ